MSKNQLSTVRIVLHQYNLARTKATNILFQKNDNEKNRRAWD